MCFGGKKSSAPTQTTATQQKVADEVPASDPNAQTKTDTSTPAKSQETRTTATTTGLSIPTS